MRMYLENIHVGWVSYGWHARTVVFSTDKLDSLEHLSIDSYYDNEWRVSNEPKKWIGEFIIKIHETNIDKPAPLF